ncbi:ankyrin repeat-containing domain protein [Aspergillus alliaceus]|uniref:ankyrin repeat-containing domain protein n=1 Tax=Petromyces alliaceus TaxID=209559 RepID=UPI0012A68E93|nr:ankyrin repeat-containing domain protein [Aspergillus alliaceus]KAB8232675.1 ankyrin repeat-containing domain protein [Aspergillus alliaceus]
MPSLLDMPSEILYHIIGYLILESDINSLARTNCHLYNISNLSLYHFNATHGQMSALLWAINHGIVKTAQHSLNASFGVLNNKLEIFYHAPSIAVQGGHINVIKILLLQEGVDPNFQCQNKEDKSSITFLARAAQAGHVNVVALLLSTKGINPNLEDDMGRPNYLCRIQQPGYSDLNFKDYHGRTPLSWTVSYGSEAAVPQFLSQQDIDVNAAIATKYMFKKGCIALMFAASRRFTEKVELLLNTPNINVNHQCASGKTALHLALLLAKGAHPDPRDRYNLSPLFGSASNGHLSIMKLLYEAGVDLTTDTGTGDTALTVASSGGHADIVSFLRETGKVDLASQGKDDKRNPLDYKGRTPLSYVVEYGDLELITMLVLNISSIDPGEMDVDGETLLSYASRRSDPDTTIKTRRKR